MKLKKAKITLKNPDLLVWLNEAAAALVMPELQFTINEDGLTVSKLDSSKAAHLKVFIPATDFESYNVPVERVVCIDMEGLTTIVKRIKRIKDELIEVEISDNEMVIANVGKPRREFTINLLTPSENSKDLVIDLPTKVVVDAEEMNEQVKDLIGIAAYAIIEVVDGILTVNGEGDKGKVSVQTSLTELEMVKSHEGPNAKSMYAMGYFEEAFKFLKQFDTIEISFTDNKPITLTTKLGEGEIKILIAPRVERR